MNTIDQSLEVHKDITSRKKKWMAQYILSQILITIRKSHANTSYSGANLIKDCIVFKSDVIAFNPNNISILVNKHKLDSIHVSVGASNAIFVRKMQYSNNTCLT